MKSELKQRLQDNDLATAEEYLDKQRPHPNVYKDVDEEGYDDVKQAVGLHKELRRRRDDIEATSKWLDSGHVKTHLDDAAEEVEMAIVALIESHLPSEWDGREVFKSYVQHTVENSQALELSAGMLEGSSLTGFYTYIMHTGDDLIRNDLGVGTSE